MTGPAPYVAPYTRPVTVLHIRADGSEPVTICGEPMLDRDVWLPVHLLPGERVCVQCQTGAPAEQGTLL